MKISKLILYSFILLLLADFIQYMSSSARLNFNSTIPVGLLKFISLLHIIYIARNVSWKDYLPSWGVKILQLFIVWNVIVILHGIFTASSYWDWKFVILVNIPSLLMPFICFVGIFFFRSISLNKFIFKKVLIYSLPLIFFGLGAFTRSIIFIPFIVILCPFLPPKWKIYIFIIAALSIVTAIGLRANILRIFIAFALVIAYNFRYIIGTKFYNVTSLVFFITPFLLLFLGVSGNFNVFQPFEADDTSLVVSSQGTEENLITDTRTFLYYEVFTSMNDHNSFIWGEGAAGKYTSNFFNGIDRYGAEVGFLNILLYSGIIGVTIYFVVLVTACFYGIYRSRNTLSKLLSIFIAFRWVLLFAEDITQYDMNFYFMWIIIGLCLSKQFRQMTDRDIKQYFSIVFNDDPYLKRQSYHLSNISLTSKT
jgi:hypothetical protein